MIPEQEVNLTNLEVVNQPSLTYRLDFERKRISGFIDNEEAIMQLVMKILYTERYAYVIYSSQYGVELDRLIGQEYDFIISDLERTITEALLADDRILSITDFTTEQTAIDRMAVSFRVNSVVGATNISTEVQIV
ncbi:MAG: DUF2634 domain-containing protein [Bacteroidales bacterium]|jgi:hypothetical protein|nr:DUF2634 domain-containing protein [Bacteroidales bacterium]